MTIELRIFLQVEQSIFGPEVKQSAVLEWSVGGALALLDPVGEGRPVLLSLATFKLRWSAEMMK
jgi:hypothetical protein